MIRHSGARPFLKSHSETWDMVLWAVRSGRGGRQAGDTAPRREGRFSKHGTRGHAGWHTLRKANITTHGHRDTHTHTKHTLGAIFSLICPSRLFTSASVPLPIEEIASSSSVPCAHRHRGRGTHTHKDTNTHMSNTLIHLH